MQYGKWAYDKTGYIGIIVPSRKKDKRKALLYPDGSESDADDGSCCAVPQKTETALLNAVREADRLSEEELETAKRLSEANGVIPILFSKNRDILSATVKDKRYYTVEMSNTAYRNGFRVSCRCGRRETCSHYHVILLQMKKIADMAAQRIGEAPLVDDPDTPALVLADRFFGEKDPEKRLDALEAVCDALIASPQSLQNFLDRIDGSRCMTSADHARHMFMLSAALQFLPALAAPLDALMTSGTFSSAWRKQLDAHAEGIRRMSKKKPLSLSCLPTVLIGYYLFGNKECLAAGIRHILRGYEMLPDDCREYLPAFCRKYEAYGDPKDQIVLFFQEEPDVGKELRSALWNITGDAFRKSMLLRFPEVLLRETEDLAFLSEEERYRYFQYVMKSSEAPRYAGQHLLPLPPGQKKEFIRTVCVYLCSEGYFCSGKSEWFNVLARIPGTGMLRFFISRDICPSCRVAAEELCYSEEDQGEYLFLRQTVQKQELSERIRIDLMLTETRSLFWFVADADGQLWLEPSSLKLPNDEDIQLAALAAKTLYDRLRTSEGEKWEQKLLAMRQRTEERKAERVRENMIADMQGLMKTLYGERVLLDERKRCSLEYTLGLSDFVGEWHEDSPEAEKKSRHTGIRFSLSLRILSPAGKYFVVKDIRDFLNSFDREATFAYGKNFFLTHCSDNFDETAKKALRILFHAGMGAKGSDSYRNERKCLPLSPGTVEDILSVLAGKTVLLDGDTYTVSDGPFPCGVSVDKDSVIRFDGYRPSLWIAELTESLLVIDREKKRIFRKAADREERQLLLFAFDYHGKSLAPIMDTFRGEIYPRLSEHISLAPEKTEEFLAGTVQIDACFDLEDGSLSVQSTFSKDGKALKRGELTSLADGAALRRYDRCLTGLGFGEEAVTDAGGGERRRATDENDVLTFLSMDFSALRTHCRVFLSDSLKNKVIVSFRPPVIRVRCNGKMAEAFAESGEYTDEELEQILSAIRHRKKYTLLSGDRILRLDGQEADEFADTVTDLKLSGKGLSRPAQIPIAASVRGLAHESGCTMDGYLSDMIRDIRSFKSDTTPLPAVRAELRDYQKEGFRWMHILSRYGMGGILADDMGLGKTLEVITLLKSDTASRASLIVCPKSLIFNWKSEYARFDPDTEVREIYGPAAERDRQIEGIDYGKRVIYITSYDSLRNDHTKYTGTFGYLILDEAQYIKNVYAKKSRTVKELSAEHRFALTGTPVENHVIDLWSIFDFILPGYFEELNTFRSRYENEKGFAEKLARRVAPFVLRRTKKDVLKELPDKFERILSADMTQEQRRLYEAYKKKARDRMKDGGRSFDLLPMLTRLRQICVDPAMFMEDYSGESGKMIALGELLTEYVGNGHRVLIFSQFVKGLESVEKLLKTLGISYFRLTGETPSSERIRLVNVFNNSTDVSVFLVSLKAGGTGLNLVGADTVIHLDPWWNTAAENQATDRSHRIGQTKNVEVIKLICGDSVEQRVVELQNEKKELADRLISSDDSSVTGITLQDIALLMN